MQIESDNRRQVRLVSTDVAQDPFRLALRVPPCEPRDRSDGFSITALMVIGIAISNGILLVDDANRRFNDEGTDKIEAVVASARSRFVPIAMTSIATASGLIPTATGVERGSEANQPLALAVVGGLTSSTLLSLFLVPVMFYHFRSENEHRRTGATVAARGRPRVIRLVRSRAAGG